ncbi:MAG: DUF4912 domain-containing protein [Fimbriiglobus sp.]
MSQSPRSDRSNKPAPAKSSARPAVVAGAAKTAKPVKPSTAAPKPGTPAPRPAINGSANGSVNGNHPPVKPTAPKPIAAKPAGKSPPAPTPPAAAKPSPAKPSPVKTAPAAKTVPVPAPKPAPKPVAAPLPPKPAAKPAKPTATRIESTISPEKDLAARAARATGNPVKDQIWLSASDPYWLHAYWQLSVQSVQRAEAALGQDWHGAKPILRLFDVTSTDTTSTSEAPVRDIAIHGGCNHWHIDIGQPPRSYRADIGYLTKAGRFFPISRSNVVTPPKAGASEVLDETWPAEVKPDHPRNGPPGFAAENNTHRDHPEDRFQRPMKEPTFGPGAVPPGKLKKFFFDIDAELIVYGKTDPSAAVTLQNEPVKLRPDGTFTMRFSLPDSRQIIPAVATAGDGMEEQTIVLAVERNTKRLDPMIHDLYGDN